MKRCGPQAKTEAELLYCAPFTKVERTGPAKYTLLIRGKADPERSPRWSERDPETRGAREVKDARKRTKLEAKDARAALLADITKHPGTTYNAACVRSFGTTADVTSETIESALWALVDDGTLIHTMEVPVRFILTAQTKEITC